MTIKLIEFGKILTGREFGADVFKELKPSLNPPVIVDFTGVESLGSSFGDEVIPPIAKLQGGEVEILNANKVIRRILTDIAFDGEISITHKSR